MRAIVLSLVIVPASLPAFAAEADTGHGAELFRNACVACHSVSPDKNMTGPSLSGVWHRKAGSLPSFTRYSPALKASDVIWDDATLDAWLTDPQHFIPGNSMLFSGIADDQERADLIGFLKDATAPGSVAQDSNMTGMMGMGADVPNLKQLPAGSQVASITFCGDTYNVTTANGETAQFWERNLRFKTDGSDDGPKPGAPAIVGAGMVGDRASVIFAAPEELVQFIKREC